MNICRADGGGDSCLQYHKTFTPWPIKTIYKIGVLYLICHIDITHGITFYFVAEFFFSTQTQPLSISFSGFPINQVINAMKIKFFKDSLNSLSVSSLVIIDLLLTNFACFEFGSYFY